MDDLQQACKNFKFKLDPKASVQENASTLAFACSVGGGSLTARLVTKYGDDLVNQFARLLNND